MLAIFMALERWRPYLVGTPFQVLTDHQALQYLTKDAKLSRR